MDQKGLPYEERLAIFFGRLDEAESPSSSEDARRLIASTLNSVEDEFSGIPYDPEAGHATGGRMYPPMDDSRHNVHGYPEVVRFRARRHNVFIRNNGAFEIHEVRGRRVVFTKPGLDGRDVWTK
jgi:hypothetical protein